MLKFICGLVIGIGLAVALSFGGFSADAEVLEDDREIEMELAYYRYHHDTLSDALAGKCSR